MVDDRDSQDDLLEEVQSSVPTECPYYRGKTDSDREARDRQIAVVDAWNRLSEKMVCVVRTIQKNEERMLASEARVRRSNRLTAFAVWAGIAVAIAGAFYLAIEAEKAVNNLHRQTVEAIGKMGSDQQATLTAVTKLSEAVGLKLAADVDPSPAADAEAATAALDAQKAALEAKKQVSDSPAAKAEAERKIKKVEAKRDKEQAQPLEPDFNPKTDRY